MSNEHIDPETGEIISEEKQWQADKRIDAEIDAGSIPTELVNSYGYWHQQSKSYQLTSLGMSDLGLKLGIGTISIDEVEHDHYYKITACAKNFNTGLTRFGKATELKYDLKKLSADKRREWTPTAPYPLEPLSNIDAAAIATTRAEKNAIGKLIPADQLQKAIDVIEEADKNSDYAQNPDYRGKKKTTQAKPQNAAPPAQAKEPEPTPQQTNGQAEPQEDAELVRLRGKAFALYRDTKDELENFGLPESDFWAAVKLIFKVESRADMTPRQWQKLTDLIDDKKNWKLNLPLPQELPEADDPPAAPGEEVSENDIPFG